VDSLVVLDFGERSKGALFRGCRPCFSLFFSSVTTVSFVFVSVGWCGPGKRQPSSSRVPKGPKLRRIRHHNAVPLLCFVSVHIFASPHPMDRPRNSQVEAICQCLRRRFHHLLPPPPPTFTCTSPCDAHNHYLDFQKLDLQAAVKSSRSRLSHDQVCGYGEQAGPDAPGSILWRPPDREQVLPPLPPPPPSAPPSNAKYALAGTKMRLILCGVALHGARTSAPFCRIKVHSHSLHATFTSFLNPSPPPPPPSPDFQTTKSYTAATLPSLSLSALTPRRTVPPPRPLLYIRSSRAHVCCRPRHSRAYSLHRGDPRQLLSERLRAGHHVRCAPQLSSSSYGVAAWSVLCQQRTTSFRSGTTLKKLTLLSTR
jgi:hypothetical protein